MQCLLWCREERCKHNQTQRWEQKHEGAFIHTQWHDYIHTKGLHTHLTRANYAPMCTLHTQIDIYEEGSRVMCSNHTFSITQSSVKQKSEHSTDSLMKTGSEKNTTVCCLELKSLFALLDHNVSFSKVRLDLKHDMNSSQTQLAINHNYLMLTMQ